MTIFVYPMIIQPETLSGAQAEWAASGPPLARAYIQVKVCM
jgi:hypothetical protein